MGVQVELPRGRPSEYDAPLREVDQVHPPASRHPTRGLNVSTIVLVCPPSPMTSRRRRQAADESTDGIETEIDLIAALS